MSYKTKVASLDSYEKGSIDLNDDLTHYAFSNIFEVANSSAPFERVMVVSNIEYCTEVIRVEGESPWYTAPHDEYAIVMDGEVEFNFCELAETEHPSQEAGASRLEAAPQGKKMGRVVAGKGHQVLLPSGSAYQLSSSSPAVTLVQTLQGPESIEKWSEICVLN